MLKNIDFISFKNSTDLHDTLLKMIHKNRELGIYKLKFKSLIDKWEYSLLSNDLLETKKGNIQTWFANFTPINGLEYETIRIKYTARYIKTTDRIIIKDIVEITIK